MEANKNRMARTMQALAGHAEATEQRKRICCFCRRVIEGHGHNPYPLGRGRCCDECHDLRVLPARMRLDKVWSSS
jgi:hypothetical protein